MCAADVVEVCPPADPQGITALAAERAALEIITGIAVRRNARSAPRGRNQVIEQSAAKAMQRAVIHFDGGGC
ncbi:hypothetical protein [Solirubrobacter soli]|uniref:hypothetical protein n=1 Tax=Solirubrobacter soli TaxID=363832 RepID=UPI00352BFCF6